MSVTASVTLSLADIDKLRDEIKELTGTITEKDYEIAKLKADSRQVLITQEEVGYGIDEYMLDSIVKHPHMYMNSSATRYGGGGWDTRSLAASIKSCMRSGISLNKKVFYKNLDDVQKEIRDKLELEYQDELRVAKSDVRNLNDKIKEVRDEEAKKRKVLEDQHEESMADQIHAYSLLVAKYEELETGKREISKIEELNIRIAELVEQLEKEKSKSWLKKLFS